MKLKVPLIILFALAALGRTNAETAAHSHYNVILITISTLRADHTGCLGYEKDTTTRFDRFSKESVLFTNAFAVSSWAMPSHGSIFTSLYPTFHGATHIQKRLDEQCVTLAEILRDHGFYCAGFCCNPRVTDELGFAQGFDFFDDYSARLVLESTELGRKPVNMNQRRTNDLVNDAAMRWLQNNTRNPFFLFLHYYDNHWDYVPPEPYGRLYDPDYRGPVDGSAISREPLFSNRPRDADVRHIAALYDGEVKRTDEDLGAFLDFLKSRELLNNSIVVIAGDHGEQFYEHGNTSHHGIHEELIRVPLAVAAPGPESRRITSGALVSQVDIMPTILDLLGIAVPDACQGKSLGPLIRGENKEVNDAVIFEYTGGAAPDARAARSKQFKYVEQQGESFVYDLQADRAERKPLKPDTLEGAATREAAQLRQLLRKTYGAR